MWYSILTLVFEYRRFVSGVVAVAFSLVLILLQGGLLLGLFAITSWPIDNMDADIWVGAPSVLSVDVGSPIPDYYLDRLNHPEISKTEVLNLGFGFWTKPSGGSELCLVIGSGLRADSLGAVRNLSPQLRVSLQEPGSVVVDRSDLSRLGVTQVGDIAQVMGHRVRVVGLTDGVKSMAGPMVFCSLETSRPLLNLHNDQTMYLLAKCNNQQLTQDVVRSLGGYQNMVALTKQDFSDRTRMHWLTMTKGGIALGYAAALGLLVGAMVTSQTMYAATMAMLKEYTILWALGVSRWRVALTILQQTFLVGVVGILLGISLAHWLAVGARSLGAPVQTPAWVLVSGIGITAAMTLVAGLASMRAIRRIEPNVLLR